MCHLMFLVYLSEASGTFLCTSLASWQLLLGESITDITDMTKKEHYIKKKTYLYTKFNNFKNATITINNITLAKKVIK